MFRRTLWIGLALSLLGFVSAAAGQGAVDKRTKLTFNQPVEIAGHVLPAGTYTFMLVEPWSDRNVVEIYNADATRLVTIVTAIPNYRRQPTGQTVIRFGEAPAGSPEVIRAWFYPGDTFGREFVYPKRRAAELAKVSNAPVPAMPAEASTPAEMKAAPVVAVTPEEKEVPVVEAIQTTPPEATTPMEMPARKELPKTASSVPLIALLGLGSICIGVGLVAVARRAKSSLV
jgi:hypothetical protein